MRNRRAALALAAVGLLAVAAQQHPVARVSLITHDIGDPAPHRMQAAVDLGVVGVSFLYTWTAQHLR